MSRVFAFVPEISVHCLNPIQQLGDKPCRCWLIADCHVTQPTSFSFRHPQTMKLGRCSTPETMWNCDTHEVRGGGGVALRKIAIDRPTRANPKAKQATKQLPQIYLHFCSPQTRIVKRPGCRCTAQELKRVAIHIVQNVVDAGKLHCRVMFTAPQGERRLSGVAGRGTVQRLYGRSNRQGHIFLDCCPRTAPPSSTICRRRPRVWVRKRSCRSAKGQAPFLATPLHEQTQVLQKALLGVRCFNSSPPGQLAKCTKQLCSLPLGSPGSGLSPLAIHLQVGAKAVEWASRSSLSPVLLVNPME